jgi:hypothetical protein
MSLSDSLVYAPKPSAVSSSKARWNQPSYNKSSFNPGEVIMLNIPTGRRGSYLNTRMSYLKFRVTNTGTLAAHTIAADFNIASLFSRFELYHGSNLLEQIHEYGALVNLWHDMTGNVASHATTSNLLEGQNVGSSLRTGEAIPGGAVAADNIPSRVFCIPLLSGIVGVLQSKYLPTGDMTAGDLRLELTLAEAVTAVVGAGAVPKYTVSEVELMLEYTDLASDAARMVSQSNAGGYMISFDSFANFASSLEVGAAGMNILIPARYSSLKTLFTIVRETAKITTHTERSISGRTNLFGDGGSWYYSIGGKNIPSTPVKTNTEAAAELVKALHAFGAQSHTSMLTRASWIQARDGTYIIAADLESLPHKSKLSEAGVNTLSTNTYLIGQFPAQTQQNQTIHTFAHYDGILVIQNGLASVQF